MKAKHKKILPEILADPVNGSFELKRIEALFLALGAERIEGDGSTVGFVLDGVRAFFHRPHPDKAALRYHAKDAREFFDESGVSTMNKMIYRDYVARIEYDEEDRLFVGHIVGIDDIVGFHGASVDELEAAFHAAVDDYIAIGEKTGRAAQKPYSGNLMLRVGPDVHAATAIAAQVRGKSLNQWAKEVLNEAARQ